MKAKKIILLVILFISLFGYSQELEKLDYSDLNQSLIKENKNLEQFRNLFTNPKIGIAYINNNSIKKYNTINTIKLIHVSGNSIKELTKRLDFSNSVQMIIINIKDSNFKIDTIDCTKLKQYRSLKFIYFNYQIDSNTKIGLKKFNCLPFSIKQYYTKQLAS